MFGYNLPNTTTMKTNFIFNRYKACIYTASWTFNHYYKYSNCYSIRSVDEEMQSILRKVAIAYAKLISFVELRKRGDNSEPLITDIIDECEALMSNSSSFFLKILHFLNSNYEWLLKVFDSEYFIKVISKEIEGLEQNLAYANKLVSKMDIMLKTSQHVYDTTLKLRIA